MLSHGLVSCSLFYCVGILYERYKTRNLLYFGGLAQVMPIYSSLFMIFILSNLSFPGTSSFVGEILVLVGLFNVNVISCLFVSSTMVLACVYSLWLLNRLVFGNLKFIQYNYSDLSYRECLLLLFFLIGIIYLGLFSYKVSDFFYSNILAYNFLT